jgi:two-component system cell cycle response regulator
VSTIEPKSASGGPDLPSTIDILNKRIERLERREWWMWWASVVVMLLLTVAVVSAALPQLLDESDPIVRQQLGQAVRGLAGLVLLFNVYSIYQYITVRRLRRQLAEQIRKTRELEDQAESLYRLAVMDPLTGLYNRRFADQCLAAEIARSQRHGRPFTVVCVDVDNFKQINDAYGHAAGDMVLREFAERLRRSVRTADTAARIGGDEFFALLLECTPENSARMLARLGPFDVEWEGQRITVGISAGWTGFQESDTPETVMARADRALYESKRKSKVSGSLAAAL